jgi:UDP:flavonoid glycosyltransferase YjiC (YdhE family)
MAAMIELDPATRFEIFTKVPRWFFEDSLDPKGSSKPLGSVFGYHSTLTDIGLAQATALREDLAETVRRLNGFLPFDRRRVRRLALQVRELGCALVMCDIAPLGIAVAREAGLPSVLVENFTWDWIYQAYAPHAPELSRHIATLRALFDRADYHIQTEPVCDRRAADLITAPVSRPPRTPARQIRQRLGIADGTPVGLVTRGGIPWEYTFMQRVRSQGDVTFIVPGAGERLQVEGNLIRLPHHSDFYHPDLVNASDAVIGKLGYSTLAEVYRAGVPFGYIPRPGFRESPALEAYVQEAMRGLAIDAGQFADGSWLALVPRLLALPRIQRAGENGAAQVAEFVKGTV